MVITAKRYNKDVYRIVKDDGAGGGEIVGFAIRLTNEKWSMTDTEDRSLDRVQYGSPKEVAERFMTVSALAAR